MKLFVFVETWDRELVSVEAFFESDRLTDGRERVAVAVTERLRPRAECDGESDGVALICSVFDQVVLAVRPAGDSVTVADRAREDEFVAEAPAEPVAAVREAEGDALLYGERDALCELDALLASSESVLVTSGDRSFVLLIGTVQDHDRDTSAVEESDCDLGRAVRETDWE